MSLSDAITDRWIEVVGREASESEASDLGSLVREHGEQSVLTCLSGYLEFRPKERPGMVEAKELIAFLGACAGVVR